ncbi:MAG: hypothetical protein ACR2HR_12315 [Euzebya sp.]
MLVATGLASACVPPVPPGPVAQTGTSQDTSQMQQGAATPPDNPVAQARTDLAQPALAVAELTVDVARRVDFIRHEVPRGEAQRRALEQLDALSQNLVVAIDALESVIALEDDPAVEPARLAATRLVTQARSVGHAVDRDVMGLRPVLDFDAALDLVVDAWDARGTRSEIAQQLTQLVDTTQMLVGVARHLDSSPPGCPVLSTNRIRWAQIALRRTRQLQETAENRQGAVFDQLHDRFRRAPFGEDRAAADAEARACWARRTDLLQTQDTVADLLADLDSALSG